MRASRAVWGNEPCGGSNEIQRPCEIRGLGDGGGASGHAGCGRLVLSELPGAKAAYDGAPDITELGVDLGLSGLAPMGWDWWLVHPDTPDDVTGILRAAMARAMNRPDVIEAIERVNHVPLEWDYDQYEEVIAPVIGQLESMGNALTWEEEELKKLK